MVENLKDKTLEEVSEHMAGGQPGSPADQEARAEFLRRQTEAVIETAKHTKRYAKYMFWSVVFLALSAFATFLLVLFKFSSN